MKKSFFTTLAVLFGALLLTGITACAMGSRESGSVTFVVDGAQLAQLANRSAQGGATPTFSLSSASRSLTDDYETSSSGTTDGDNYSQFSESIKLTVALRGDYTDEKTVSFTYNYEEKSNNQQISFSDIPVGSSVYAVAILTFDNSYGTQSSSYLEYFGLSDNTKITAGNNNIPLTLRYAEEGESVTRLAGKTNSSDSTFELVAYEPDETGLGLWTIRKDWTVASLGTYTLSADEKTAHITERIYVDTKTGAYQIASGKNTKAIDFSSSGFEFTSENGVTIAFELETEGEDGKDSGEGDEVESVPFTLTLTTKGAPSADIEKILVYAFDADDDVVLPSPTNEMPALIEQLTATEPLKMYSDSVLAEKVAREGSNITISDDYALAVETQKVFSALIFYKDAAMTVAYCASSSTKPYTVAQEDNQVTLYFQKSMESSPDTTVSASGTITVDNGTLTISMSDGNTSGTNAATSYTFAACDSSGNDISDNVTWSMRLSYQGNEIPSDSGYYSVDKNVLTLSADKALPAGTYQLYVTATYNGVTASSTFDITITD